ncbi:Uncharacterised protein [uncultured archaeon]|nr:Uncharacterised protein [uncultured archaeon]
MKSKCLSLYFLIYNDFKTSRRVWLGSIRFVSMYSMPMTAEGSFIAKLSLIAESIESSHFMPGW